MKSIERFLSLILCILAVPSSMKAQELLADSGPPGKQHYRISLKNSTQAQLDSSENETAAVDQFEASLNLPLHQTEDSTYGLHGKSRRLHFNKLPATQDFVPVETLYNQQYGVSWAYQEENKNTWGLNMNYGSASDKPFEGADVCSTEMTLTRKIVQSATSSWVYFLSYSNNRSILNNIPLPGFAYLFSNDEKTKGGAVGLPFISLWWRPNAKLSASIFLLPTSLQLQSGYMVTGPLQANLKFEYGQQVYMRSGRENWEERLFFETKKLATSLKSFFGRATFLEIELARVYDRSLYNGKSAYEKTSDRMTLPHEWQITSSLQASF